MARLESYKQLQVVLHHFQWVSLILKQEGGRVGLYDYGEYLSKLQRQFRLSYLGIGALDKRGNL
jgi:hypothetical protein